jgi:hypothetical protein
MDHWKEYDMKSFNLKKMVVVLLMSLGVVSVTTTSAGAESGKHDSQIKATSSAEQKQLAEQLGQIEAILKNVESAQRAVESGDKKSVLKELSQAKDLLNQIREKLVVLTKPAFVNTHCPIMGSPITPEEVTPNLVREYKGQKVAFCCGGCPGEWDKLSDKEKEAKLKDAIKK